ncbi:MAG: alpha-galactosidase [Clostridia bacterium]|nr:alpha-galactosidase [Clostridia bacterium]
MNISIKAAAAFYTSAGIKADSVQNPKLAKYRSELSENTYNLYVTSKYVPAGVSIRIPFETDVTDTVFMNGFQSATESRERAIVAKMSKVSTVSEYVHQKHSQKTGGDYDFVPYKNKPGVTHGFSYCYFRQGDKIKLFASLDESTGFTVFKYDAWSGVLKISKDVTGVQKFDNYNAMSLFFCEGSEEEVFDKWFGMLSKSENAPADNLVGYSTKKLANINEDIVCERIESMDAFPVKANIFLVEGKYCEEGDWLRYNRRNFPIGMREISDLIKEKGMLSGIALSPFTVDEKSNVFKDHGDWILRMEDGRFCKTKDDKYILNSTNPEVKEYVREVLHTILFMWGFDLVKLNNLYAAGVLPTDGKSRGELMCDAMKFLRECCGGKLMYACDVPLMPAFGIADYCAVSCGAVSDNVPSILYSKKFYRESASVKNASADIVFRRMLNGRAFLNAPCEVSLYDKDFFLDGNLNNAEQNVLTTLEGLFSPVLITTDDVLKYNQKQKRRFKKMCSLGTATEISVRRVPSGHVVGYRHAGKSYIIKF